MPRGGCEQNVESALRELEGVSRVEADREGEAVVDGDVSDDALADAVRDAGYEVGGEA